MRAITILKYGKYPIITNHPLPVATEKQSVVCMHYAPINPSDLNFYIGSYGVKKQLPTIMGFEGSGVVVQSQDKSLINKVVSVRSTTQNGTYSTHMLLPKTNMVVWPEDTKPIDVACAQINPFTAIGLRKTAQKRGYNSVLLSAANSALSKMMIRYFNHGGMRVYGIVRKKQQVDDLLTLGAHKIFVDTEGQQQGILNEIQQLKDRLCFIDCVGGDFAGTVFNHLPASSTMINYGRLSKQRLGNIDLGQLYYKNKRIEGFWLNTFMSQATPQEVGDAASTLIKQFKKFFTTQIGRVFEFENYVDAMKQAAKGTSGKIILHCS